MLIKIGATFHFYGHGSGPTYTFDCDSPTGHGADQSECAWTLHMSCSHANDAGVSCLSFEDVHVHSDNDACPTNMIKVNDAPSTSS